MNKLFLPILITGPPHSGKSLLAKILGQCDQFYCFGEPLSLWNYGMKSISDDIRLEIDATPDVVRKIRSGIESILIKEKKSRYLDEFSYHLLRVRFLKEVLPEAKVIMLVRDPADVIPEMMYFWRYQDPVIEAWKRHKKTISLSTLPTLVKKFLVNYLAVRVRGRRKSWGPIGPDMKGIANLSLAETVVIQWENLVRIGLNDLQMHLKYKFMIIKFENMVSNPRAVIADIAKFCEINDYEDILHYADRLLEPTYRFNKRDKVDPHTSLKLDTKIKEMRQRLGYEFREEWL